MTTTDTPPDYVEHDSLAAALSAFQGQLPHVGKTKTAKVTSDKANYTYNYADLADVAKAAHPVMARHGLSFSSKPTLNEEGKFVLRYALRHDSGQEDVGEFPLPSSGTMQAIGSSLTYCRRYVFCAITGIVADEDTDGAGSAELRTESPRRGRQQPQRQAQPPAQRQGPPQNGNNGQRASEAEQAREALRSAAAREKWDGKRMAEVFAQQHGVSLKETENADHVRAFMAALTADAEHVLGQREGAAT